MNKEERSLGRRCLYHAYDTLRRRGDLGFTRSIKFGARLFICQPRMNSRFAIHYRQHAADAVNRCLRLMSGIATFGPAVHSGRGNYPVVNTVRRVILPDFLHRSTGAAVKAMSPMTQLDAL